MGFVCRVCNIELNEYNWHKYKMLAHNYICKSCTSDYNTKYHIKNKQKESDRCCKYYKKHAEKRRLESKEWKLNHPIEYNEYMKKYLRSYFQTEIGKIHKHKMDYERRDLGYYELNSYFKGSHAHHINTTDVIYIPINLHKSIWHSLKKNMNMDSINTIAYFFILQQNIMELINENKN